MMMQASPVKVQAMVQNRLMKLPTVKPNRLELGPAGPADSHDVRLDHDSDEPGEREHHHIEEGDGLLPHQAADLLRDREAQQLGAAPAWNPLL